MNGISDKDVISVLAFDTSAYTTSAAAVRPGGSVLADERRLLDVKQGQRGLRQSQAFFQHMANLPALTETVCNKIREEGREIRAVGVSTRPRPEEDSYMPVFMAGYRTAQSVASVLNVPLMRFSHQEGHIAAAAGVLSPEKRYLVFHLSGGTSELLLTEGCRPVRILGASGDLSFGQLIDRTGVAYGMKFPAGAAMDQAALAGCGAQKWHFSRRGHRVYEEPVLGSVSMEGSRWNLSGVETSCMKAADRGIPVERTASELFLRISDVIVSVVKEAGRQESVQDVVFAGGVASSRFLREQIWKGLGQSRMNVQFGEPVLCSDNAVGVARLAMASII